MTLENQVSDTEETSLSIPQYTNSEIQTLEQNLAAKSKKHSVFVISFILLTIVLVVGAYFRFTGMNWDDSYHLHPDERFLTDVASLLHSTDLISYLKTSESTLNPYNFGKSFYVYGNFPMTISRLTAEGIDALCQKFVPGCVGQYIYFDGIHLVGRALSAVMDLLSIILVFVMGKRLYDWKAGLFAALLMAVAVLPIQQSHFFTMDNWAATLTTFTLYIAVIASEKGEQKRWWVLYGIGFGLTLGSRINLAPLAVISVISAFIWLYRCYANTSQENLSFWSYLATDRGSAELLAAIVGLVIAAVSTVVVFRLAQPYAFVDGQIVREIALVETGEEPGQIEVLIKSIISLNPQWKANLSEVRSLQSPEASFPPALQWTDRTAVLFPLMNIILWGMGLTAGIATFLSFLWAFWRILRAKPDWLLHTIPVVWITIYFLFMATRWVKSIRYFLPIYPALFILTGWAVLELWRRAGNRRALQYGVAFVAALIIIPSILWANTFVDIYLQPVTRIQASEWIFDHVPSGATLLYDKDGQTRELQLPLRRYEFFEGSPPAIVPFVMPEGGQLTGVRFNYLRDPSSVGDAQNERLVRVQLVDSSTNQVIAEEQHQFTVSPESGIELVKLDASNLLEGKSLLLSVEELSGGSLLLRSSILANEHWDDSLPVRYEGRDPFSMYYDGVSEGQIPITHPDSEDKRASFYRWLDESDYIMLSSQRALWSLPRLPLTYPLTVKYYESLFNGDLGFDLVYQNQADFNIGPIDISDIVGKAGWQNQPGAGWPPPGIFAAEEAFSVYDHPPVWIFSKNKDYDPKQVQKILGAVDISNVVVMTPGQATKASNGLLLPENEFASHEANGTFSRIFDVDGLLSKNSWLAASVWWLILALLGWISFPLAFFVFNRLPDGGYPFGRILSLLAVSYFVWITASLKILPNTRGTLLLGFGLLLLVNGVLFAVQRKRIIEFFNSRLRLILFVEILALILFGIFIGIRLGNPDVWDVIWGGEKPMDLSYFNAILKSTSFPPYDPWFSGGYINYYYYGFVYVGVLAKMLGIVPAVAYNLIIPMVASLTGLAAFSVVYNLVALPTDQQQPQEAFPERNNSKALTEKLDKRGLIAGVIAVVLALLVGNLAEITVVLNAWHNAGEAVLNTGIQPLDSLAQVADGMTDLVFTGEVAPIHPGDWFWTATRAINVRPGEVQPITEFPFFTFLYGDLHAHMFAFPITIFVLGWALSRIVPRKYNDSFWQIAISLVAGALSIGALRATNTWDFPTYLLIGMIAVGYGVIRAEDSFSYQSIVRAVLAALALILLSALLFLPFTSNYSVPYNSFSLWEGSYTQFTNYLLIYGLFLVFILTYLIIEFRTWTKSWTVATLEKWEPYAIPVFAGMAILLVLSIFMLVRGYWIAPFVLFVILLSSVLMIRPRLPVQRRAVLFLISLALSLTLVVEVIVLDGDIGRMNTVFKFYLQVWFILSIASGAAAVWSWSALSSRRIPRRLYLSLLAILFSLAALYPILATKAKWETRMSDAAPITLDGMAFMPVTSYGDTAIDGSSRTVSLDHDYEAIRWMQKNIVGSPVIAEAHSTNPYRSVGNRVSMYTGLPSIIGWDWHQRQQRAILPPTIVSSRIDDVNRLYNTEDAQEALDLLSKYNVSYVYVGPLEWTYYLPQGLNKFDEMVESGYLREVYRNVGVSIYEVIA